MSNRYLKDLDYKFTEIVASQLHYFEANSSLDYSSCTASDIRESTDGWLKRFQNDCVFNARVKSIVAQLMQEISTTHSEGDK